MRAAIREFLRRGVMPSISSAAGKIICMSSVHQEIPWAGHANYATSKGGGRLMMESLAQEVAPHRVRVNAVASGAIRTPINTAAWQTRKAYDQLMKLVPYGHIGEPWTSHARIGYRMQPSCHVALRTMPSSTIAKR